MSRGLLRNTTDICGDCGAPDPRWASVNRGVVVCDECCSVHRSLGRHISQIKSLKKGSWNPQQLAMHHHLVSVNANSIWEHTLLDPAHSKQGRRKPNARDPVFPNKADFIRSKYQNLAFVNKQKDSDISSLDDLSRQLHSSCRTADLKTSLRLLSIGADPNYFHPEKGSCSLHVAAGCGQALQVEMLLTHGADPTVFDSTGRMPADHARREGHTDLAARLIEYQYELTDRIAAYLCGRRPDHRNKQHFIIPEMTDSSLDLSELAKTAKSKLQALPNHLFEELAMDVYDEVDRRENEDIWLMAVQTNNSSLVTDKQTVPFLPVNPEFSATRNQGRQKLARFNKREFATLIIDILSDARRRHQGINSPPVTHISNTYTKSGPTKISTAPPTLTPIPSGKSTSHSHHGGVPTSASLPSSASGGGVSSSSSGGVVIKRRSNTGGGGGGGQGGGGEGGVSDDEPLYDTVCSDEEDYASIDSHSLHEEDMGGAGGGDAAAKAAMPTPTTEQVLHLYPSSGSSGGGAAGGKGGRISPVPQTDHDLIAQYERMKLELIKCQQTVQQVVHANDELKKQNTRLMEELSSEKNMRKHNAAATAAAAANYAVPENYDLPNGHPGARNSPGAAESHGRPVSMFEPRQWKHQQRVQLSHKAPMPDPPISPTAPHADQAQHRQETHQGTSDSQKSHKSSSSSSSSLTAPSLPARLPTSFILDSDGDATLPPGAEAAAAVMRSSVSPVPPSGAVSRSHAGASGVSGAARSSSGSSASCSSSHRSSSRSTSSNMTPTDSALALAAITESDTAPTHPPPPPPPPRDPDPSQPPPLLPTQEEVVRKTERITKKIQELLRKATEDKYEGYLSCAEKIQVAVNDMLTLFPKQVTSAAGPSGERINHSLQQLRRGAVRLREQCARQPLEVTPGHPELRGHTQQVIQCAYDIAQAAKQLVICFE